jgi:hypothetical protein
MNTYPNSNPLLTELLEYCLTCDYRPKLQEVVHKLFDTFGAKAVMRHELYRMVQIHHASLLTGQYGYSESINKNVNPPRRGNYET